MRQAAQLSLEREQILQVRDERRRANCELVLRVFRSVAGTALLLTAIVNGSAEKLGDVAQALLTSI